MSSSPPIGSRALMLWFAIDAVVAMTPPLYWLADGRAATVFGVPGALFYFLSVSTCVTASLVAAPFLERASAR